jgi:hypothetical protein
MSSKAKKQQPYGKDPVVLLPSVRSLAVEVSTLEGATTMTPDERRRAVKARGAAGRMAELAVGIITEHPELGCGVDQEAFQKQMSLALGMRSLRAIFAGALRNIEDSILALEAEAWLTTLEIYSAARKASRRLPDLGGVVGEMKTLLAQGPRTKKLSAATPAMPAVSNVVTPAVVAPATKPVVANPSSPANTDGTESGDIAA